MTRTEAVDSFLNGNNGFIERFLNSNSGNKVAVVGFFGEVTSTVGSQYARGWSDGVHDYTKDTKTLLNWTDAVGWKNSGSKGSFECTSDNSYGGTNYEAGFLQTAVELDKVKNDGHRKVMIFLSDGAPTFFQIDADDSATVKVQNGSFDYSYTLTNGTATGLRKENGNSTTAVSGSKDLVGYRGGDGVGGYKSGTNDGNVAEAYHQMSQKAFDELYAQFPGMRVYTISVGLDDKQTLEYMYTKGNGTNFDITNDMTGLENQLLSVFFPKGVEITDNLSKYVRYNSDNPDVLVTMTNINTGKETVLWDGAQSKDKTIFNRVEYVAADTSDTPTGSTGTVKAIFNTNYELQPDYRYTLSFNVRTTQTAYDEYKSNGKNYGGVIGNDDTDYGSNKSSSLEPGFHSNTEAYVTYTAAGVAGKDYYNHPVIQVVPQNVAEVVVKKVIAGGDMSMVFNFTITYTLDGYTESEDFTLGHNNTKVFEVPLGATVRITEKNSDGYSVLYNINGNDMKDSFTGDYEVNEDTEYVITNVPGTVMPSTGGSGTAMIYTAGIALVLFSLAAAAAVNLKSRSKAE